MTARQRLCVIVQPIDPAGMDVLRAAGLAVAVAPGTGPDILHPMLAEAVAVITRNFGFPSTAMAHAPHLRVIGVHGTGTDRIDMEAARARGIVVVNTPGANAQSVAEHALALILAAARRLTEAERQLRAGNFDWRLPPENRGMELAGKCLGLWGYGHIARRLARMAKAIGLDVLVLSRHADPAELAHGGLARAADADDLLERADILSLHGVPGPRPLLGPREFAMMRPGAILVNTARGALVDEDALAAALTGGQLAAAALDVFTSEPLPADSPLTGCPNLVLTPHIGGATAQAMRITAEQAAAAVVEALAHAS